MPTALLQSLAALILEDRDKLLSEWQAQVRRLPSAQRLDTLALKDHLPKFLDELATSLPLEISDEIRGEILEEGSSSAHGSQRVKDGFDIEEVVTEYNVLRNCIHDLAECHGLVLKGRAIRVLNNAIDKAIGLAVRRFAEQQALEIQRRREEYLAFVAHDLRTPLAAISMAAYLLESRAEESARSLRSAQTLKSLKRNAHNLEALVNKMLQENISLQLESGVRLERREFDLWPLVEGLIHDLLPVAASANTQLKNEVPEELIAYADASLLKRVFQNLIANAIKHTPGGQVVISALGKESDGSLECQVRDNGEGIPPERIEKVFDKFETDSSDETAKGLGLAIVKSFVEAHGGQVRVESTLKLGSIFRFTLPPRQAA